MTDTATAASNLLPLQVQEANYKSTGVIYLTAGTGDQQHEIAAIACLDPLEAKAIAERICRAVNAHDALLEAAKNTLDYWQETGFAKCENDCDCVVEEMRAAIARAEPQP